MMTTIKRNLLRLTVTFVLTGIGVATTAHADVSTTEAWVRATVPGQTVTGAFMKIESTSEKTLIGASSDIAEKMEIHRTIHEDGVSKMRHIDRLELKPNKPALLEPGGFHLMMFGLHKAAKVGETVTIQLHILGTDGSSREDIEIEAEVRSLDESEHSSHGHDH